MCGVWRGYDVAGVGGGEFALQLVSRQRVAPLYWRSDTHTHTVLPTVIGSDFGALGHLWLWIHHLVLVVALVNLVSALVTLASSITLASSPSLSLC